MELGERYSNISDCRICGSPLVELVDYHPIPLVNDYCSEIDDGHEDLYYPLTLMYCSKCYLVQIKQEIDTEVLYHGTYSYIPSASQTMVEHFGDLAKRFYVKDGLAVDIGSNDGTLLSFFQAYGMKILGVEPAKNLAEKATLEGIPTLNEFFNEELADQFLQKADVITSTNVIANSHNIISVLKGVRKILSPNGIFIMETPNFLDLQEIGSFDSVYHEHFCYFTPGTAAYALESMGFEVLSVERISVHGGSIRVVSKIGDQRNYEYSFRADYSQFQRKMGLTINHVSRFLDEALDKSCSVIGWGAPAKATVMLHQVQARREHFSYITDTTPYKQYHFLPGLHIPILPQSLDISPDFIFVNAWNFREEVMKKLKRCQERGTKIVFPIPFEIV